MTAITHQNMHSFCRTCLAELKEKSSLMGEKYNIQEHDLLEELITVCTPLPLQYDTKYPDFVCRTCYEKLQSFYDFRCMAMQSLCVLNNIIKEFNEKRGTKVKCSGLDSGQGGEDNIENKEWNKTDEVHENNGKCGFRTRSTATEATTTSPENQQNCIENTMVKVLQDPSDSPSGLVLSTDSRKEVCKEIEEKEIDISDVKKESQCDVDALDYLGSSSQNSPNTRNAEDKLEEDCTDSSASSSTKDKSAKKSAKSQSRSAIGGGAQFYCDQCPRRCVNWENYEAHLRTHQGLKPFLCKECGRSFNKAFRYREHMRETHAPIALEYICSYEGCGKVFKREGTYKIHCRVKHKYVNREPEKFICEECGSTFKNATRFKEHRLSHAPVEEYPFKCEECGKQFRVNNNFKEHQLRHSGVKKFICPYCGIKKTTQQELRRHINHHTKEKMWPCPKCTSVFNSSSSLSRHNRSVHEGVRFACKYCDESFVKRETLKYHEMRHTGEMPHGCDICGKRFIQSAALRSHMAVHNKG